MDARETPRPTLWPVSSFSPRQIDWLTCAAGAVVSVPTLIVAARHDSSIPLIVVALVFPLQCLPLLWRRRRPGRALVALVIAFAVTDMLIRPGRAGLSLIFGVYAATLYGDRRTRHAAAAVSVAALVLAFGTLAGTGGVQALGHAAGIAFGCGLGWIAGERTRIRHAYLSELEDRARRAERDRDEQVRFAAEREASRIARELHDVVVHHVAVIAVQAGAARKTADLDPTRAVTALGVIERTARETLTELRSLLGLLRRDDTQSLRQPAPTLSSLDALVTPVRAAGIDVTVRVDGDSRSLPAVVELCGFRAIQEALTNVVKHAPGAHVHVLLRYLPDRLDVVVSDDGPGPANNEAAGGGLGLIGMRERVAAAGGTLTAGRGPGGGFEVQVRLPMGAEPVEETDPAPTVVSGSVR